MDSRRRWNELSVDCLVNVFGRVGLESLILDIPLVCKQWHQATLNPLCWQELTFCYLSSASSDSPEPCGIVECLDMFRNRLKDEYKCSPMAMPCLTKLIRFAVDRSGGLASTLWLPSFCDKEALTYLADKCPCLKKLGVSKLPDDITKVLLKFICKWENLESVFVGGNPHSVQEIFVQIGKHCKNLESLTVLQPCKGTYRTICNSLPRINSLHLMNAEIFRDDMVFILEKCRELVDISVSGRLYFKVDDKEILRLTSHIRSFRYQVSTIIKFNCFCDADPDYLHYLREQLLM